MQCSRINQYDDRTILEKERTHEYFLSGGYLLNGGVVGAASPRCWVPLLIHRGCQSSRGVALLDLGAVAAK
jgi:hypothetical protein